MPFPFNPNFPSGFTPVRHAAGGSVRPNYYSIAGGLANNLFRGDLVKPATAKVLKNIDLVAAGNNPSIGAFKGVNYVDQAGNTFWRPYWPTGTLVLTGTTPEAYVFDDPEILFDVMVSGATGLATSNTGNTANLTAAIPGNTATGQSGEQLDQTTLSNASTTQQLQVEELEPLANNQYGQFSRALVRIFLHFRKGIMTPY